MVDCIFQNDCISCPTWFSTMNPCDISSKRWDLVPLPFSGSRPIASLAGGVHQKWHWITSKVKSEKAMQLPPCSLEHFTLNPEVPCKKIQLSWGFCAAKKPSHMEKPHIGIRLGSSSLRIIPSRCQTWAKMPLIISILAIDLPPGIEISQLWS